MIASLNKPSPNVRLYKIMGGGVQILSLFCPHVAIHTTDENWAILGYYAVSSGKFLPTFLDNLSVLSKEIL